MIAGLTGGIATGKSAAAACFQECGARIVDADRIAAAVSRKGQAGWAEIVEAFGQEVLGADGELDRERMGRIVFSDPEQRKRLESIIHPRVYREMTALSRQYLKEQPDAVVIQDIPLLFETGKQDAFPLVIVVYVPETIQRTRLMRRNGYSEADALARIRAQMPIEEKRRMADIVIDNSGLPAETADQVRKIYERLKGGKTR